MSCRARTQEFSILGAKAKGIPHRRREGRPEYPVEALEKSFIVYMVLACMQWHGRPAAGIYLRYVPQAGYFHPVFCQHQQACCADSPFCTRIGAEHVAVHTNSQLCKGDLGLESNCPAYLSTDHVIQIALSSWTSTIVVHLGSRAAHSSRTFFCFISHHSLLKVASIHNSSDALIHSNFAAITL